MVNFLNANVVSWGDYVWSPEQTEKQSGVLTPWVSIVVQRGSSSLVSSAADTSLNSEREREKGKK